MNEILLASRNKPAVPKYVWTALAGTSNVGDVTYGFSSTGFFGISLAGSIWFGTEFDIKTAKWTGYTFGYTQNLQVTRPYFCSYTNGVGQDVMFTFGGTQSGNATATAYTARVNRNAAGAPTTATLSNATNGVTGPRYLVAATGLNNYKSPGNARAYMFGGSSNASLTNILNDLYVVNEVSAGSYAISKINHTGGIPALQSAGLTYVNGSGLWLFGGYGTSAHISASDQLWHMREGTTVWERVVPTGVSIPKLGEVGLSNANGKLYITGGLKTDATGNRDTFEFDISTGVMSLINQGGLVGNVNTTRVLSQPMIADGYLYHYYNQTVFGRMRI